MIPLVRLVLALCLAFGGVAFASAASAQTCEERRARMVSYEAEAQQLREDEPIVRSARLLGPSRLDRLITEYRLDLGNVNDHAAKHRAQQVLNYLEALGKAYSTGVVGPNGDALLAQMVRRRDELSTNISHSRAAMESLRCGATAATDLRPSDPNATSASGCQGYSGVWNTNWGVVTFNGSAGSYLFRGINSSISGTIQGRRYSGHYHQPGFPDPEYASGEVIFTLSADGNSWSGESWNRSHTVMQPWSGTCAGPRE